MKLNSSALLASFLLAPLVSTAPTVYPIESLNSDALPADFTQIERRALETLSPDASLNHLDERTLTPEGEKAFAKFNKQLVGESAPVGHNAGMGPIEWLVNKGMKTAGAEGSVQHQKKIMKIPLQDRPEPKVKKGKKGK